LTRNVAGTVRSSGVAVGVLVLVAVSFAVGVSALVAVRVAVGVSVLAAVRVAVGVLTLVAVLVTGCVGVREPPPEELPPQPATTAANTMAPSWRQDEPVMSDPPETALPPIAADWNCTPNHSPAAIGIEA
jgi:hypothetical protein